MPTSSLFRPSLALHKIWRALPTEGQQINRQGHSNELLSNAFAFAGDFEHLHGRTVGFFRRLAGSREFMRETGKMWRNYRSPPQINPHQRLRQTNLKESISFVGNSSFHLLARWCENGTHIALSDFNVHDVSEIQQS